MSLIAKLIYVQHTIKFILKFYNKNSASENIRLQFSRRFIIPENVWAKGFRMYHSMVQTDIMTQNTCEQKSMSCLANQKVISLYNVLKLHEIKINALCRHNKVLVTFFKSFSHRYMTNSMNKFQSSKKSLSVENTQSTQFPVSCTTGHIYMPSGDYQARQLPSATSVNTQERVSSPYPVSLGDSLMAVYMPQGSN